jgi:dCMP deaminase
MTTNTAGVPLTKGHPPMNFDWSDLAFGSKKPINSLGATFIAAPRAMSAERLKQLVKAYLPHGNIVIGIAKEPYVADLEGQPQFRTLQLTDVEKLATKVNSSSPKHKLYTLSYFQREAPYIFEKLNVKKVVLVRGSWHKTFHTRPEYYKLVNRNVPYEMVSPFASEAEARAYEQSVMPPEPSPKGTFTDVEMLELANHIARRSFDYSFQIGCTLGKKQNKAYEFLAQSFNTVVPYQAYAMHHGAAREVNFSPPHDLNFYDTVHAEVMMIIKAQKERIDLKDTTLFINVLPCPMCARMFTKTDIAEYIYREDHSDGYGVKMLERAGKKVTRIVE